MSPSPRCRRTRFLPSLLSPTVGLMLGCVLSLAAAPVAAQKPARPHDLMFRQYAPGLLARTVYAAEAGTGPRVQIWDLLVGPGRQCEGVKLPGGAVLEVRGGEGRLLVDGKAQELRSGQTLAVAAGSSIALVNGRADLGLAIRAVLVMEPGR